jgi:uncharacterized repeat protein (TIGR01451 family)
VSFVGVTASHGILCDVAQPVTTPPVVACSGGTIPSGETATVTITVLAAASCSVSPIINTATLTQPVVTNNTATNSTVFDACVTSTPSLTNTPTFTLTPTVTQTPTATVPATFDLSVTKVQTAPVAPAVGGDTLTYTVTVTNLGPTGTATGVSFIDNAPPPVNYTITSATNTATTGAATPFACVVGAGNVITCSGATIPVGDSATVTITGTITFAACNVTLSNTATLTAPPDSNAVNNTSTVSTPVACANLDVTQTDLSPLGGNFAESSASNNWNSSIRYTLANNSPTTITGISYVVTMQSAPVSMPTFGIGQVTTNPGGWACAVTSFTATSNTYTCTGDLAGGASVVLDFSTGTTGPGSNGPASTASNVSWTTSVTCVTPGACVNNTASPANSDGSLLHPTDTDPIWAADLDATSTTVGPTEDLTAAAGYVSQAVYDFFNDAPDPITGITVGGTISGSATRNTVTVGIANGSNGPWLCTTTTSSWSCSGNLDGELPLAANGDNANTTASTGDKVTLTVSVAGTGAVGETVVYDTVTATCTTPAACVSGTAGPSNMDGGVITQPAITDALVA